MTYGLGYLLFRVLILKSKKKIKNYKKKLTDESKVRFESKPAIKSWKEISFKKL